MSVLAVGLKGQSQKMPGVHVRLVMHGENLASITFGEFVEKQLKIKAGKM